MTSNVNRVLNEPSFVQWLKNLRELSKTELKQKEAAITHALDFKSKENQSAGLPPDLETERLTAQLEACYNELAKCDLQTQILSIISGTMPLGVERLRLIETVKCKQCGVSRSVFAPSGDLASLTENLREAFIKRAAARIVEQLTEDHRLMNQHASALSMQIPLRA